MTIVPSALYTMPLPRPVSVSTVTTEGSTCRTSAGMSPPGAPVETPLGAAAVVVAATLVVGGGGVDAEDVHPATKTTVAAATGSIPPRGYADNGARIKTTFGRYRPSYPQQPSPPPRKINPLTPPLPGAGFGRISRR